MVEISWRGTTLDGALVVRFSKIAFSQNLRWHGDCVSRGNLVTQREVGWLARQRPSGNIATLLSVAELLNCIGTTGAAAMLKLAGPWKAIFLSCAGSVAVDGLSMDTDLLRAEL